MDSRTRNAYREILTMLWGFQHRCIQDETTHTARLADLAEDLFSESSQTSEGVQACWHTMSVLQDAHAWATAAQSELQIWLLDGLLLKLSGYMRHLEQAVPCVDLPVAEQATVALANSCRSRLSSKQIPA